MKLDTPFIRLPLQFDAQRLAAEVEAVAEDIWRPHPQGHAGNSALPLVAAWGDPLNDATAGPMRATPVLSQLPYLQQVMEAFGCTIGRSRLMRIDGNAEATLHVDSNYYWATHTRIHVPIVTTPNVAFICGDMRVHMPAGECWIFDTWSLHNVLNPDPTRRIHLVCDTVGSAAFWHMAKGGLRPTQFKSPAAIDNYLVEFDPQRSANLICELTNQAVVMTPFEVTHWWQFALAEIAQIDSNDQAALQSLRDYIQQFQQAWTHAWSRFGILRAGHGKYRALLDGLDRELEKLPASLHAANGTSTAQMLRQLIVRSALNPDIALALQDQPDALKQSPIQKPLPDNASIATTAPWPIAEPAAAFAAPAANPTPQVSAPAVATSAKPNAARFDRPIFIISAPRSGSTLLFETLMQSPDVWTIGGESHQLMEMIPELNPARVNFDSNRVSADKATANTVAELTHGFFSHLRNRDGKPATATNAGLRFLEKTPKNALRVSFLAKAYPDAQFVYLYRDPRETISSMLQAWRSPKFVTYPKLPGWTSKPWSLLLTPGWREWNQKPLHEIVARQWSATIRYLVEDLAALDSSRVVVSSYADLIADPQLEIQRLCVFLGIGWDKQLDHLPPARHTLTAPEKDKWKHNEAEINEVLPIAQPAIDLANAFFEQRRPAVLAISVLPPTTEQILVDTSKHKDPASNDLQADQIESGNAATVAIADASAAPQAAQATAPQQAFNSVFTPSMVNILTAAQSTLLVTTYQSGRVILLRKDGNTINTHFKAFQSPMGVAYKNDKLVLSTTRQVWEYHNQKGLAKNLDAEGKHDACFVPRKSYMTGDIRIHEIGYAQNELWIVNTRFSCLCTLDGVHNFVPRWQPKFITKLEAGDRCHLNGMTIIDDQVKYVTTLSNTDTAGGWREHKATGGLLMDVSSNEVVASGLSMPHSPRWYDGKMWVLESGKGALSTIDLQTGVTTVVTELPGFTRGLTFIGDIALVGLSQVRESVFGGLPLTERLAERVCGVWAVNIRSGKIVGFLRFEGIVQEIFDLQFLPGIQFPELLEPEDERLASMFILPDAK